MKINITKAEYRNLLTMLEIADWVMSCMETEENSQTVPYKDLEQKVLSYAKKFHCEDWVEFVKKQGTYYHTKKFEEESLAMGFVDDFTEDTFWDELIERLSRRDVVLHEGKDKFIEMEIAERFEKTGRFEDEYKKEFAENGLKNLRIVKDK